MKKRVLCLAVATALLLPSTIALAADSEEPPPPIDGLRPATYDWSGFYAGAWAGATCVDGELTDNNTALTWEMSGCGWRGGVVGGYNQQFNQWVAGLEGDWGMSGNVAGNSDVGADFTFATDQKAAVRARTGIAMDDTLLFLAGGVAWAQGNLDGIIGATPYNIDGTHWGWSIGGGFEHAMSDHVRIRLEYLYTRFASDNYFESVCGPGTCDADIQDFDDHEVKAGVLWAF